MFTWVETLHRYITLLKLCEIIVQFTFLKDKKIEPNLFVIQQHVTNFSNQIRNGNITLFENVDFLSRLQLQFSEFKFPDRKFFKPVFQ